MKQKYKTIATMGYIDKVIAKDPQHIPQQYYNKYSAILHTVDLWLHGLANNGIKADKQQILYMINHEYKYNNHQYKYSKYDKNYKKGYRWWCLEDNKIFFYKHEHNKNDGTLIMSRSRTITLDKIPPDIYIIGNCVCLICNKQIEYLPKEYRLNYVVQRSNRFYGFCANNTNIF